MEPKVDDKYFIERQNRKGKKIILTGKEETPCCLNEQRTAIGEAERLRNKKLLGLDTNSRNSLTAQYVASTSKKSPCLTGAIRPVNFIIVHIEDGFGDNSLGVRMPTPIECERLQGFPDNRTLVPYEHRMMSDTQRYKQV